MVSAPQSGDAFAVSQAFVRQAAAARFVRSPLMTILLSSTLR
jgi:hypothetical protein